MAERHNNPLNMKLGSDTKYLVDTGVATVGEPATDGGNFLRFKSMADGIDAATKLLTGPRYNGLTIDAALRKWSNNGYGGEVAESVGIDPKLRVRDLSPNQITWLTGQMVEREMGTSAKPAAKPSVFGSTDVISPGGVAEIPKGTRMSIPNPIFTRTPETQIAEPTPEPTRKTEPAAPVPAKPSDAVADLLNLPMSTEPTGTEPASITVDIEKPSPSAPTTPQQVVAEIKRNYDLRGLNPSQVGDIVGHVLESRKISAAKRAAQSQLIETEDGYVMVNKETGELTPLTSDGRIKANEYLQLNPEQVKANRLSEFSKEMSAPDNRLRGRMNESQARSLRFGSRALQANERQTRLEARVPPQEYANQRTYLLQTLESLPADVPMNVINQILSGTSLINQATRAAYDKFLAENPKADDARKAEFWTTAGLGASEARAMAVLYNRRTLTPVEREFLANQLDFATAMLRDESGAAINAGEFLNTYRQYFPMEGDTEADVLRKMRTRRQAIRGLRTTAGRPLLSPDVD